MNKILVLILILIAILALTIFAYSVWSPLLEPISQENIPDSEDSSTDPSATDSGGSPTTGQAIGQPASSEIVPASPGFFSFFTCENVPLSYSLGNFIKEQTCIVESNGFCYTKEVRCEATLTNFDEEVGGTFSVNMIVHQTSDSTDHPIASQSSSQDIGPEGNFVYAHTFVIEGNNANTDITCTTRTTEVPTKQEC